MPKIYTPDTIVDEVLTGDARYNTLTDAGVAIESNIQIALATSVAVAGTSLDAAVMNNLEDGLDALDTKVADILDALVTAGTSTAFTVATPGAKALATYERFSVKFHITAGAAPTLNRDSKGAKALKYYDSSGAKVACSATTIITDMITDIIYDGTDYVLMDALPSGVGGTVAIANGGTGQTTANAALDALTVKGADIVAASTTDIAAGTGESITITGNTTITAFGTAVAGVIRVLNFTGTPLLTHNAASLILPAAANYQVVAGDVFIFQSLGSGNWRCIGYALASGKAIVETADSVTLSNTVTLTNKRITKRVVTVTQAAEPTMNTNNGDIFIITGLAQAITSMTTNLTTNPNNGDMFELRVTDNGTSRAITLGSGFLGTANNSIAALATTINKTEYLLFRYTQVLNVWELVARDHAI